MRPAVRPITKVDEPLSTSRRDRSGHTGSRAAKTALRSNIALKERGRRYDYRGSLSVENDAGFAGKGMKNIIRLWIVDLKKQLYQWQRYEVEARKFIAAYLVM